MPGQLKTRRRRRGGRGRGRRRSGGARNNKENAVDKAPQESSEAPEQSMVRPSDSAGRVWLEEVPAVNGTVPTESGPEPLAPDLSDTGSEPAPEAAAAEGKPHARARTGRKRSPRRKRASEERRAKTKSAVSRKTRQSREAGEGRETSKKKAATPRTATRRRAPTRRGTTMGRGATARRTRSPRAVALDASKRTLVVNHAPQETRVAMLEHGSLAEIFIERQADHSVVGNIYKGRVTKVLPGMQSAFVNIGLERDAFLYVSDISLGYEAYEGLLDLDDIEGGQEIRDAAPRQGREAKIEELIKEGQELLVQVTKEPIGTKGARITSYVTLPGRFLVLMPQVDHVGVSRKIGDARERSRLRRILDKIRKKGVGFIVRTVAKGCDAAEVRADADFLMARWEETRAHAEKARAPVMAQRELTLVPRVLRDLLTHEVTKVIIDDKETYDEAVQLVTRLMPDMVDRVERYRESFPIFEKYGVQSDIDKALKSRVWLKSGGSIVINQTEALVAIDVNTGKFVGKRSLEETVLKTNLEAATEIVRQLRLRDLGGIIVVDFIDMEERKNKKKLIEAFEKELLKDRARTKVLQISDFGLVEITRQRTKKSLERILTQTCPYCAGAGKIKDVRTVLYEIQRELKKLAPALESRSLIIRANPEVARCLETDRQELTAGVDSLDGIDMAVRPDSTLHHEQFEILSL